MSGLANAAVSVWVRRPSADVAPWCSMNSVDSSRRVVFQVPTGSRPHSVTLYIASLASRES